MTDPVIKELLQKAEAEFPTLIEKGIKKLYQHEFIDFDVNTVSKMTKKELAAWQSQFPLDSPQYIIEGVGGVKSFILLFFQEVRYS